jgi:MscS family membrane protein
MHLVFKGEEIDFVFYIIFLFLFAWWFYEIIKFVIYVSLSMRIEKDKEIHQELFVLFLNIIKVLIALVIIFAILARMGVNLTGLATSLGIGGIVLGLSAKDTLTNFFDSIRLIGENAFHIGDWIETEQVEGVVTEIGLAATCIRTFDNALVTIPNSKLAGNYIKNWSKRKVGRQIKFKLRLQYTYEIEELERVITEIRHMLSTHPAIMNDQKIKSLIKMKKTYKDGIFNLSNHPGSGVGSKLLVYLDEIDVYSMNILIYAFSTSIQWEEWLKVKQEILLESIAIVDKSTLKLALPQEEIVLNDNR